MGDRVERGLRSCCSVNRQRERHGRWLHEDCQTFHPRSHYTGDKIMRQKFTEYLHSDKSGMYETGSDLRLSDKALEKFIYAFYEVKFECEVDTDTGEVFVTSFEGRKL